MNPNLFYSNTKMDKFSEKDCITIIKRISPYLKSNLGVNKRKKKDLVVEFSNIDDNSYGQYHIKENVISLNMETIPTLGLFIRTLVHEYTHYTQPCLTNYSKLFSQFGYNDHPFELEAYKNELIHGRKILNQLRKSII